MRAKEYLEINKNKILYYNLVKGAIEGLCPLRNNKKKTEEYFNRYLFADARYHLQPDGFKQREGEVNKNYAYDVRIYIMNAVYTDESFIFAFNIILMQKNKYYDLIPLNFCEIKEINSCTISNIESICTSYKEDYPKSHICDYLLDDNNMIYLNKRGYLTKGGFDWWRDVFNKAYEHFDNIRIQMTNGFDLNSFVESICTDYNEKDYEIVQLVSYLFSDYNYDIDENQIKKYRFLSNSLLTIYNEKFKNINKVSEPDIIEYGKEKSVDYLSEIEKLKQENEELKGLIEKDKKSMTCSQQVIAFIYLLNSYGINTDNTRKSSIARFINRLTGTSETNVRKRLEINYDDIKVKYNLRIVAETFQELLPNTSEQILRDIEGE